MSYIPLDNIENGNIESPLSPNPFGNGELKESFNSSPQKSNSFLAQSELDDVCIPIEPSPIFNLSVFETVDLEKERKSSKRLPSFNSKKKRYKSSELQRCQFFSNLEGTTFGNSIEDLGKSLKQVHEAFFWLDVNDPSEQEMMKIQKVPCLLM